jgi:hypothetical protein
MTALRRPDLQRQVPRHVAHRLERVEYALGVAERGLATWRARYVIDERQSGGVLRNVESPERPVELPPTALVRKGVDRGLADEPDRLDAACRVTEQPAQLLLMGLRRTVDGQHFCRERVRSRDSDITLRVTRHAQRCGVRPTADGRRTGCRTDARANRIRDPGGKPQKVHASRWRQRLRRCLPEQPNVHARRQRMSN